LGNLNGRELGRNKIRWEDNIKTALKDEGCDGVD
jgi:hypothetical protein